MEINDKIKLINDKQESLRQFKNLQSMILRSQEKKDKGRSYDSYPNRLWLEVHACTGTSGNNYETKLDLRADLPLLLSAMLPIVEMKIAQLESELENLLV